MASKQKVCVRPGCTNKVPARAPADAVDPYCDACLDAARVAFMPGVLATIANAKEPEREERDPARTPNGRRARAIVEALEGHITFDDAQSRVASDASASVLGDERDDT